MIRYFFTVRDFHPLLLAGFSGALRPNTSLKLSANGRPPGPSRRYAVHFRHLGPGVLPLSPAQLERQAADNVHISLLTSTDAPQYRELMLEACSQAADAYTSTAEERAAEPMSWWVKRIAHPEELQVAFGAWEEGKLVGTVALEYSAKPKTRHSALLIAMYVRHQCRGTGMAAALLHAAINHAHARSGVTVLTLTVTEGNGSAMRLYERAGFAAWGTEPLAILTPSGYKGKVHMWRALAGGESAA